MVLSDNSDGMLISDLPSLEPTGGGLIEIEYSNSSTRTDLNALSLFFLPVGTLLVTGANPPDGWLICDGQTVSREEYSRLFDAVGEAFGSGDGQTTFNLPKGLRQNLFGEGTKLIIRY